MLVLYEFLVISDWYDMKSFENTAFLHIMSFLCFVLIAKGAIQKEVVYFGLPKQEVVIFQRPAGEDRTFSVLCVAVMMSSRTVTTVVFSILPT